MVPNADLAVLAGMVFEKRARTAAAPRIGRFRLRAGRRGSRPMRPSLGEAAGERQKTAVQVFLDVISNYCSIPSMVFEKRARTAAAPRIGRFRLRAGRRGSRPMRPSLGEAAGDRQKTAVQVFLDEVSKYCSISPRVLPLVSGRKKAAVMK